MLAELTRGHLLSEHRPGRYAFHDLLRAYATEQAQDPRRRRCPPGRGGPGPRPLAAHRVRRRDAARPVLRPGRPGPAAAGVVVGAPATAEDALRWFTAEQATLLAAVPLAAWSGRAGHAWRLAWALSTFLLRRGCWDDHDQGVPGQPGRGPPGR